LELWNSSFESYFPHDIAYYLERPTTANTLLPAFADLLMLRNFVRKKLLNALAFLI
jgi:hypothetical protein